MDPLRYDIEWWREQWRRTRVQGVIINAGGIVAYYPSCFPLHRRAEHLGDRDLFGELVEAARREGLVVLARMDSSRLHQQAYDEHPEWFARDRQGAPFKAGDQFITCINSPYYKDYLPQVLGEIIERYHPEGFTDNSWSGLGRGAVCYCEHCAAQFREATGSDLPVVPDWDEPVYRQWIRWSYQCRLENWDLNSRVAREAGGQDCLWLGMLNGDPVSQSRAFRDLRAIGRRSQMIMCDHQGRGPVSGFEQNGLNGKLLHGVLGWDKLVPESMAMYVRGVGPYRIASAPPAESRTWMIEGFAGGISPWWHHIGAWHEDRRQYGTAEPVMRWHEANEQYLYDRVPVATVGILWSQDNIDFYGRDDAEVRVTQPFRGFTSALTRARIPYLPVHCDQVAEHAEDLSLLILPNVGAMSDEQARTVNHFVERGGGLVATGQSSLFDQRGDRRSDFALSELFGAHPTEVHEGGTDTKAASWDSYCRHSYLRLLPSMFDWNENANNNTMNGQAPRTRHEVLAGFEETDIVPFGGRLECVQPRVGVEVPLTYIPPFPIYPPEFAWMRTRWTDVAGLILNESPGHGRVAYLPADLDRCFAREQLPDHGRLLARLVRWAASGDIPLEVDGPGHIDCHLYRQVGRLILHLVNLTHCRGWPDPGEEPIPVGPFHIRVRLPEDVEGIAAFLLVSQQGAAAVADSSWATVTVESVLAHEVVVIA
jgi:hypothetical protein